MKIKQILLLTLLVSIVWTDQAVSAVAGNDAVVIQNQTEADSVFKQFKKDIQCLRKGTCTKEQKIRLFKQAFGLIAFVVVAGGGIYGSKFLFRPSIDQLKRKYDRLEKEWDGLKSDLDAKSPARNVYSTSLGHYRVFARFKDREQLKLAIKHMKEAISIAKASLKKGEKKPKD